MRIAVTPGEPAGIGPELLVRQAQLPACGTAIQRQAELIAIADPELLERTATYLGLPLTLHPFSPDQPRPSGDGHLSVQSIKLARPATPGVLDVLNAPYVLDTLDKAARGCMNKRFDALVTGPVQKSIINDAGIAFSGHTEFFAERANHADVVMMLATKGLRVALATTHLPLKEVPQHITQANLIKILGILIDDLRNKFGIANPTVLVCGLNPHAGEGGHLGKEEIDVIIPALESFKRTQAKQAAPQATLIGPLPADTLFTEHHLQKADAVLAMYHDQGLPVLKYKGFGNAVNITLGLPFIRTSVDHGTALDLAGEKGRGSADLGSLQVAIETACAMVSATSKTPR